MEILTCSEKSGEISQFNPVTEKVTELPIGYDIEEKEIQINLLNYGDEFLNSDDDENDTDDENEPLDNGLYYLDLLIGKFRIPALVDSGATKTFISPRLRD